MMIKSTKGTAVRKPSEQGEVLECLVAPDEDFDYADTFLSAQHVVSSFLSETSDVYISAPSGTNASLHLADNRVVTAVRVTSMDQLYKHPAVCNVTPPPYRVQVWHSVSVADRTTTSSVADTSTISKKRKASKKSKSTESDTVVVRDLVLISPYIIPIRGPYPADIPPQNSVEFTKAQAEAIRSGMNKVMHKIISL